MATQHKTSGWEPPAVPESVVPDEAFDVGEPAAVGRIDFADEPIEINAGRESIELVLVNTGDRPVQIGAHYHLFEANRAMAFDREAAYGFRLDVPSGSAIRFEPGQSRKCRLVRFVGREVSMGMNDLTNGSMRNHLTREAAVQRARARGYCFEGERLAVAERPDDRYATTSKGEGRAPGKRGKA